MGPANSGLKLRLAYEARDRLVRKRALIIAGVVLGVILIARLAYALFA